MSRYLTKYVGTYRVIAEYDKTTNDFPRLENGTIDPSFEDIYIPCASGIKILHYGGSILMCYVPSIKIAHNIIKHLYTKLINAELPNAYQDIVKQLVQKKVLIDYQEWDKEVEFKFNANNIDYIATIVKARTFGAGISPFSTKNLPKAHYDIPVADSQQYAKILERLYINDRVDMAKLNAINRLFEPCIDKKLGTDWHAQQRKQMLKFKEFIHANGLWQQYIKFLDENTKEKEA